MAKRVVVIFPKFEQADLIEQIRKSFDPLATMIEAHITLVPPFESSISAGELYSHIEEAIEVIQPFHLLLQGITGHEGEYLFLNVKRGNDQLITLRDRLYTGFLASYLLPEYTCVPHLTVGRLPDRNTFFSALERATQLKDSFETQVCEISVYSIQPGGTRCIEFSVPLKSL